MQRGAAGAVVVAYVGVSAGVEQQLHNFLVSPNCCGAERTDAVRPERVDVSLRIVDEKRDHRRLPTRCRLAQADAGYHAPSRSGLRAGSRGKKCVPVLQEGSVLQDRGV